MSTAIPPLVDPKRAALRRQVADPLERLRGCIRTYVTLEGAAVVLIYLALWFWIGLVVDFGFFKAFGVDWVQVLPKELRLAALSILSFGLLGLLTFKVGMRLTREFRDPALALVLERRFPNILGDRLITAVELADPAEAAKCGYSQAMIDQTIREAADAVGRVPVQEAFNWRRLVRYGWLVLGLTLALYLLVAGACLAFSGSVSSFHNVAVIWVQRNILLRDVIWPRRAHLELVGFPESGELRIGKNVGAANIRVRALKWVFADDQAPEGWRPLLWVDVKTNRTFNALGVPPPLPPGWPTDRSWTIDEIELRLLKDKATLDKDKVKLDRTRDDLPGERVTEGRNAQFTLDEAHGRVESFLRRLQDLCADPRMSRKVRMLEVPDEVSITYRGDATRGDLTLRREENNEYSGMFTDLKETVRFQACAEDYCTAPKTITVVPPPVLKSLVREESHPAYIYHLPPPDDAGGEFKKLRQRFPPEGVHLGGDRSTLTIPRGGDLRLTGVIAEDKDPDGNVKQLKAVRLLPRSDAGRKVDASELPPVELKGDKKTFVVEFKDIRRTLHFELELTDTDGVISKRQVIIDPLPDTPPRLKLAVDPVVRKTNEGYKITPSALIPFTGSVEDDRGLAKLEFHASHIKGETPGVIRDRTDLAVRSFGVSPTAGPMPNGSLIGFITSRIAPPEERSGLAVAFPNFQKRLADRSRAAVSLERLHERLKHRDIPRAEDGPLRLHKFDQEEIQEYFDVAKHLAALKAPEGQTQPRHRLELWVVATDNNVETGPGVTESDEHYNFIVVSEAELLADINGEEAKLHDSLKKVKKTAEDGRSSLDAAIANLVDPNANKETVWTGEATRVGVVRENLKNQRDVTESVSKEYRRLRRELEINRFNKEDVGRLDRVCQALAVVLETDGEFALADRALGNFVKRLEEKQYDPELARAAREAIDKLIQRLDLILDEIGTIIGINELKVELQAQITEERETRRRIEEMKKLIIELDFNK